MPSFSPGDPVLVVGGLTEEDRTLIGHATTVVTHLQGFLMPINVPFLIYSVKESYSVYCEDCGFIHGHLLYRSCDLMPLGPLEDKINETLEELEFQLLNPEVT